MLNFPNFTIRSTPNSPGYPPKGRKRDSRSWDIACIPAQSHGTQTHRVYTKGVAETERGCRRRNGVVYTYLACKHSRGLPEEQQVPTDTTAESSWLYTSPVHKVRTRKVGGAPASRISRVCGGIRSRRGRNSHLGLTLSLALRTSTWLWDLLVGKKRSRLTLI